ncbi:MAG TPA: penicillin-binding protein 2 [Micromonospora sp.]|nr:penicillin-binding protein 2 [Micromonospora sp.]
MTRRSDEPRRGTGASRRGSSSADGQAAGGDRRDRGTGRTGSARTTGGRGTGHDARGGRADQGRSRISDARAYTPRGRTVREAPELRLRSGQGEGAGGGSRQRRGPRSAGPAEPARPALQLVAGGHATPAPRRRGGGGGGSTRGRTGAPGRSVSRRPPRPPRLANPQRRLRLGTLLALALFTLIGIRLVVLQVIDAPAYANGGIEQRLSSPIVIPAPRGTIYDRSRAALAHSVEARYVFADPELIEDPEATAEALSPLLGIPRSKLAKLMEKKTRPGGGPSRFEWLARGVEIDTAKKISALDLDGIGVRHDERREVPNADLAANLIGFVGDGMVGLEGIEARYDEVLRGVDGERQFEIGKGMLAKEIPGGYRRETMPKPGSSLVLTIDRDLQYEVQRTLSAMMANTRGSVAAAVVLDVRTFEVLAQASHPTYNAADPTNADTKPTDRDDAATSYVVDPGSVHKALVFGAALEEGVITPETTMPVPSTIRKGDAVFSDVQPANGRQMSLSGMLAFSSNVGTIAIADQLGADKLYEYQLRFGLGQATEVGLPGEASGRVLKPEEWSGSSYGSIPIGHSVDVTPLQMAAAYAAIANDGTWMQPRLVKEIIAPDGTRTPVPAPEQRQVISPANAAALRAMLEAVTTVPGATGLKAGIPGYRVAGKTGTGKRIVDGKYVSGDVASFIGMAPADKPRYVVAVFAHTPHGGGGDVTAPAFRDMMAFTLAHYRVPPTGTKPPDFVVFP